MADPQDDLEATSARGGAAHNRPFPNGGNGEGGGERGSNGRFLPGNRMAAGHRSSHGEQVALLRRALFEKVTPEEIEGVIVALLAAAKDGDVSAAKLMLAYLIGEPAASLVAINASVQVTPPGVVQINPQRANYLASLMADVRAVQELLAAEHPTGGNGQH